MSNDVTIGKRLKQVRDFFKLLFENGPVYWKDIRAKEDESKQAGLLKKDLFTEEVAETIDMLKQVPMIRHSVMGHYQDCKKEKIKEFQVDEE